MIFEFTSRKTRKEDFGAKKTLYEQVFRTAEYYMFDPTGKRKKQRLWGWRLENGHYVEIAMEEGKMVSEQLGLHLIPQGRMLRLFDPVKGVFLQTYDEQSAKLAEQEAELAAHKAELARLRAELEVLRQQRENH